MNKELQFENIIEEHKDKIYRICRYYISDEDDVKDLYQDALINIWKGLDKFKGKSKISTWIFRVTVNSALAHLAKKRAGINSSMDLKYIEDNSEQIKSSKIENSKILHESIGQLPLVDMVIISLVLEDVSSKEIAKVVGLTESNVRTRAHRIKESLKEIIERREQ